MKIRAIVALLLVLLLSACAYENGKVTWGVAPPYELNQWDSDH